MFIVYVLPTLGEPAFCLRSCIERASAAALGVPAICSSSAVVNVVNVPIWSLFDVAAASFSPEGWLASSVSVYIPLNHSPLDREDWVWSQ